MIFSVVVVVVVLVMKYLADQYLPYCLYAVQKYALSFIFCFFLFFFLSFFNEFFLRSKAREQAIQYVTGFSAHISLNTSRQPNVISSIHELQNNRIGLSTLRKTKRVISQKLD